MSRVGSEWRDGTEKVRPRSQKREECREKRKEKERREKNAASRTQRFGPGMAVWHRKGLAPRREEGINQTNERRDKGEYRDDIR